ncbi:hypothetical protein BGZ60DRAFT_142089 [Tricladium varicosporioides]|nr:hypothetical protein BGZ60DRAFT_142089 [Hymenoscyphus varicosporioides]
MDRRTRTGCLTCRRRRVKCDEARPTCNRCRTANFECEGYPSPRRASNALSASSSNKSRNQSRSPPGTAFPELSYRHADWRQEQLPFYHHFVTTTAPRLFRDDHITFWRDQVAQISYGVDLVYEALLAIGAVHRAALISCQHGNEQQAAKFKIIGLRAYGNTIKLLPSHLNQDTIPEILATLVVLMLLAYFECFMENPKAAFRHLWAAIQLLRSSEERLSDEEISNLVPVFDAMLRLDFLAQKLVPFACSSFVRLSDLAFLESPFWNRAAPKFSGCSQADLISAERYRLIQLVCAHNKLSRVVWGCWCPTNERPSRNELMGFYSEMVLWRSTSPGTFASCEWLDHSGAMDMAAIESCPIPPPPMLFSSDEAALNVALYNAYMGCAVAMINTTDPDPAARELEAFNLVYSNLCIAAGLLEKTCEEREGRYKPCDAISMGISISIFHGARRCFSLAWQKWTVSALRLIGREGLVNGFTLANTAEIMYQLEARLFNKDPVQLIQDENNYLGPISTRLMPVFMPPGDRDEFLCFYLRYGNEEELDGDERAVQFVARATWKEDFAGTIHSLDLEMYDPLLLENPGPVGKPPALELFASWRQAVESGWHGLLSTEIQDRFLQK